MLMGLQQVLDCPIIECELINEDVYLITLEAPKGDVFKFQPGQYLFIQLAENDSRPYSIASTTADGRKLQLHIKDIPGNHFSGQVLEKLKSASQITVKLPAGSCTINRSSGTRPLLFIAGGTGFAPCQVMIQSLFDVNDPRLISLYWGANYATEFYLQDKLERWIQEQQNFTFIPVVATPGDGWTGEIGIVFEAVLRNISQLSDYDIYLSGSSAMVVNIYHQLRENHVPATQIFSDMLDILKAKGELLL